MPKKMFIDIAFNGTDIIFEKNIENVMERARNANVMPIIVGVDLDSSEKAIDMALKYNTFCYFGIHPLHFNYEDIKNINLKNKILKAIYCKEKEKYNINNDNDIEYIGDINNDIEYIGDINNDIEYIGDINNDIEYIGDTNNDIEYIGDINNDIEYIGDINNEYDHSQILNSVLAIGECGLDYYRASNKEEQIEIFKKQIILGRITGLNFFLHCRSAFDDFYKIIRNEIKGIVHSFDGSVEEMKKLIESGFYIGINGCSTKTQANIEMIKQIPIDKILLETDSPYCCIRKSYESQKYTKKIKIKNNEPCHIIIIAEAVANIKGIDIKELEDIIFKNTITLFPKIKDKIEYWIKKM